MSIQRPKLINSSGIMRLLMASLLAITFISWRPKEMACHDAAPTALSLYFDPIDAIVEQAIRERQFPGCQVLVMKKGEILLDRSYGYLTYDSLTAVTEKTMYDLASVTKVAATTLMFMDLYEEGIIHLDDPISCYLPEYDNGNKAKITIRQLLAHNAGLQPYATFWEENLGGDFLYPICDEPLKEDSFGQLMYPHMADSLNRWIVKSSLYSFKGKSRFLYSDLGFIILHQIAERAAGQSMEDYLFTHFYKPMGLTRTHFNPLVKGVQLANLAPTERDTKFRKRLIWGEVHDRNAVLLNGVAGHAGLFSTSRDLGVLMSMILNEGRWNGTQYLKAETIRTFNTRYFRWALGWDKRNPKVSTKVSDASFGHTGFTGTMVWADPSNEVVFVFLTNRVYPNVYNRKLITSQTRSRIQDVVYDALVSIETAQLTGVK
jgi:beta-N-acetylhexosaminidase